jgi:hypothetical protein
VAPWTTPLESSKRTKMRFVAGAKLIVPLAVANIAKVGVALALIVTVALGPGVAGFTQAPVAGFVWQIVSVTGSVAEPVSAVAVIDPVAPTFAVATEKAAAPLAPGI